MSEMYDLAEKQTSEVAQGNPLNKEKYYPKLRIGEKQFPVIKGKGVGNDVRLYFDAKVSGINKFGNGDIEYTLELRKACTAEDKKK